MPPTTQQQISDNIAQKLLNLVKIAPNRLNAYIHCVCDATVLPDTKARIQCYCLTLDGSGNPRLKDFIDEIALHLSTYVIPRSRLDKAIATGDIAEIVRLHNEARKLFTHINNSGEGGELLMYLLAESILNLPQLFCKMPLKTSSAMHVHGSDGIHVGMNNATKRLALYWGQAKLHKSASAAIRNCIQDLAPYLLDDGGGEASQTRDLQLMRDRLDLNNPDLERALKIFLDKANPSYNQVEFRGLGLIGFDNDLYPIEPNKKTIDILSAEISAELAAWNTLLAQHVTKERLASFHLELFCFPLPSVEEYRKRFTAALGL